MTCYGSVYKTIYTSYQLRFLWASYNSIQFLSPATNKGGKSGAWNQCVFSSVLSRSKASYKGLLLWHCFTQSYFWTTLFWSIAVQLYLHYFPCFLCIHELFGWPVWLMYTCFWISPSLNWENPAPMYCRFLLLGFILVLYFSFILAVLLFEFVWMVFFHTILRRIVQVPILHFIFLQFFVWFNPFRESGLLLVSWQVFLLHSCDSSLFLLLWYIPASGLICSAFQLSSCWIHVCLLFLYSFPSLLLQLALFWASLLLSHAFRFLFPQAFLEILCASRFVLVWHP